MFKFAVVMAALLAVASVAMADPTLNAVFDGSGNNVITDLHAGATAGANTSFFRNYDFTTYDGESGDPIVTTSNIMRIDVAVASMDNLASQKIAGYGIGLQITGGGANHLAPLPEVMSRYVDDWWAVGMMLPFTNSRGVWTQGMAGTTVAEKETFGFVVDNPFSGLQCKLLAVGTKIASFYYRWDGVVNTYSTEEAARSASALALTWSGDGDIAEPWMHTQVVAGQYTLSDASFNPTGPLYVPYTVVPEPATLSLLGLGLAAMLVRPMKRVERNTAARRKGR